MNLRRNDVQVLRGIALLGVLFFHASGTIFGNGYLGVDIFFLISGFVITPQLKDIFQGPTIRKTLYKFYLRRIYRLFPSLYVMVLFFTPLILVLGNVRDIAISINQAFSSLLFIGNILPVFSENSYFESSVNPFLHTWSLGVEFQIYLYLPFLLYIAIRKVRFTILIAYLSAISFLSFLIFEISYLNSGNQILGNLAFYLPITRFWEFGLGSLLSSVTSPQSINSFGRIYKRKLPYILFALFLLLSPIEINANLGLFIILTATSVFLLGAHELDERSALIKSLDWIGDRSYSIYLVHLPLMYLAKYSPGFDAVLSGPIRSLTAFLLSLILGAFLYFLIENRHRRSYLKLFRLQDFLKHALALVICLAIGFIQLVGVDKLSQASITFQSNQSLMNTQWDHDCKLEFRTSPCTYNEKGGRSVVLIGDSHAAMFGRTLEEIAIQNNFVLHIWASPACQYFYPAPKLVRELGNDLCVLNNNLINSWVRLNKPDFLIFSFVDSESNANKYFEKSSEFRNAIVKSMQELSSFSDHQALILPTPKLPYYSLLQYWMADGNFTVPKKYKREDILLKDTIEGNSITLIETVDVLCPNSVCRKVGNSGNIYEDTDHISFLGSISINPQLKRFLQND